MSSRMMCAFKMARILSDSVNNLKPQGWRGNGFEILCGPAVHKYQHTLVPGVPLQYRHYRGMANRHVPPLATYAQQLQLQRALSTESSKQDFEASSKMKKEGIESKKTLQGFRRVGHAVKLFYMHIKDLFIAVVVSNIRKIRNHFWITLLHKIGRGTLTILVRGEGINGIYVGSDGKTWFPWFGGKFIPLPSKEDAGIKDDEKVVAVNKHVIAAKGGVNMFADYITELLKTSDIDSANDCAHFALDFMCNTPYEVVMEKMSLSKKIATFSVMIVLGRDYYERFEIWFASADQVAIYEGYSGHVFDENPHPEGRVEGMCEEVARASLSISKKAGTPIEKAIMVAFQDCYYSSDDNEAVGGRIIIRKVDSEGVSLVWDGTIQSMIKHLEEM